MENEERMKTENGRRTDGLCLYVKKKTFLGQNTKSYFYVKMTYVFMFLCFWECSSEFRLILYESKRTTLHSRTSA